MNIEIKIVAPGLEAAINNLALAMSGGKVFQISGHEVEALTEEPKAEKPKRPAKPAETKGSPENEPETQVEPETTAAKTDADEPVGDLTYDDVRKAVLDLTKAKGRDAAVGLLAKFQNADGKPAANGKELMEDDWSAFVEQAQAEAAK